MNQCREIFKQYNDVQKKLYIPYLYYRSALNSRDLISRSLLGLIRAALNSRVPSNFPCSFFLVRLIELLTINAFIMSVFFINKYYNICQNLIKKRLGGPQKMPQNYVNL